MGESRLGAGREHGMERAGFTSGTDMREHRFDPALYSHLPSCKQPLPDDNHWEPPPSTLPLGWGSTQTSYNMVGIPHRRARSLGPMSTLLDEVRQGGGHPLDLHLSPTCSMHDSRTLIVDNNSDGRRPMTVATDVPTKGLSSASVNRQQEVAMKDIGAAAADSVQGGVPGGMTAAKSPPVMERIIARMSSMRATGHGERGGVGNVGCEEEGEVDGADEEESDSDDEEEDGVKEVTARGGKKKADNGRGKGKSKKGGEGGGGNRRGLWDLNESLILVRCKRNQDYLANVGSNFAQMKTKEWKWTDISNQMRQQGVMRDWDSCMKRWENVIGHYKKVLEREESGVQSFFTLTVRQRKDLGYKFTMDRMLNDAIDGMHTDVVVTLRGRIAGRTVLFYEMRHHRDKDCGRAFEFVNTVTRHEVRHFEVDENGCTCLRFTAGYGFDRGLLTHVVAFATKARDAIPDRWDFVIDVLANLVNLLVSNVAMEFDDRLDEAAAYRVHVDPPLYGREYLHGEIGIVVDGFQ
ncbi:hypothetical protein CBR_g22885 [Chara braunii]|uniref:Myb-like domain-containing protein n=1 Tax=Chara braunii TaxID=69332 RepID=A0A388L336_CHABU|nr:hypothetical protein CBR_g22885 [Chara braunii]|eukprot:GBG76668.1 hypothetical protein CBR_g22885 [Chara braunii]